LNGGYDFTDFGDYRHGGHCGRTGAGAIETSTNGLPGEEPGGGGSGGSDGGSYLGGNGANGRVEIEVVM
jgi:hypothetical protein